MSQNLRFTYLVVLIFFLSINSFSQNIQLKKNDHFPHRKNKLKAVLSSNFDLVGYNPKENVVGIIAPFGNITKNGYELGLAYSNIDKDKPYNTIFLLHSCEELPYRKSAILFSGDQIETPLGKVEIDKETISQLGSKNIFVTMDADSLKELSIFGHLTLLQYHLKNNFKVVPILINSTKQSAGKVSLQLAEYFDKNNLFVVASEFANDLPAFTNILNEQKLAEKVIANKPWDLLELRMNVNNKTGKEPIEGLSALLTLQYITYDKYLVDYEQILLKESNKNKVKQPMVFTVVENDKKLQVKLTENERMVIFDLIYQILKAQTEGKEVPPLDESLLTGNLNKKMGAYIILRNNDKLRSVQGTFNENLPLLKNIYQLANLFAIPTRQFMPLTPEELEQIITEITIITPKKRLKEKKDFTPGKHGLFMQKGNKTGYYMPDMYDNTGWSKDQLLMHCAKDRLKIASGNWQDADTYIFQIQVYDESGLIKY